MAADETTAPSKRQTGIGSMRTKVEIKNLRGVRTGVIEGLAPLSILIGPNDSGKSTVLEALWFHSSGGSAATAVSLAKRRGWCGLECVKQVAHEPDEECRIVVTNQVVTDQAHEQRSIWAGFRVSAVADHDLAEQVIDRAAFASRVQFSAETEEGGASKILVGQDGDLGTNSWSNSATTKICAFIGTTTITSFGTLESAYSEATGVGNEHELESLLRRMDPKDREAKLRILNRGGQYVLHLIRQGRSVPLYFCGDGTKRLVYLACVLAYSAGKLVLLEEPECFQHPRHLREVGKLIWGAVSQGTEVVLSEIVPVTNRAAVGRAVERRMCSPLNRGEIHDRPCSG